ncbi:MAG: nucleoside-diphosphate sugar epimerase/dehydratase [Gammaproteobacteria bacterium]|nr:nucleoside-diphosphate sugar epimerase/dehydratase [Gammaproteobacteria bacterium]
MKFTSLLANRWLALLHDIAWIPVALFVGYWVRFNLDVIPSIYWEGFIQFLIAAVIFQTVCFWYFGLYRGIWRFASIPDIFRIIKAIIVGVSLTVLCMFFLYRLENIPRSILVLYPVFLFLGISAPRLLYRWFKDQRIYMNQPPAHKQALIVGAGHAGNMLVREILRTNEFLPVGFVDDDAHKKGREIHGVRVLNSIENIQAVLEKYEIDVVIICIRNISAGVMRSILRACSNQKIECLTIPSLTEVNDDNVDISRLRNIKLEDLLGRESIKLDDQSLHNFIDGECVLVTGAGGSIGSELCRQTLEYAPKKLILLEQNEFNLYTISKDLKKHEIHGATDIIPLLRDVRDLSAIEEVFSRYRPNVVLHAAAYKHVPIIEDNIIEGVKTNIFGTKMLAELAAKYSVDKFVMVSTDKAVNPTSMMGTTKRTAEIFCQALDAKTSTQFITTRFGNVIDSTGSVVPLFREQIQKGGPVTVTHKDISRYFMSIPEAVSLILQAASMGEGGEIFVLDMGKPVKIYDLARQMIRLSGYDPDHDIGIEFIGLRPGEKLHEELFHESEDYTGTKHPKILLAESRKVDWDSFALQLDDVLHACEQRKTDIVIELLKTMIPEYVASQPVSVDDIIEDSTRNIIH